jgi:6-phosphogluconolactonase
MCSRSWLLALLLVATATTGFAKDSPKSMFVFVGTYTGGKSQGIYTLNLDMSNGVLTPVTVTAGIKNPSFVAVHPGGKLLYAVSEIADLDGKPTGGVTAFAIDTQSGGLTALNSQSSTGAGPCYVTVDKTGKTVLAANYGGGSVVSFPVAEDGKLGPAASSIQHHGSSVNPRRQEGPHAHSINVDASNRFAIAADLGLDKLLVYKLDPVKSTLTPNEPPFGALPPGSGPRHFAFHPNGKFSYTNNELTSTVTLLDWNSALGTLAARQTLSTLPADFPQERNSTAEIQVHPSGSFLYVSNRGHDSLAIFSIDQQTGELHAVGHESTAGKTPRNFGIDPTGTFVLAANQDSDSIQVFRVDLTSGHLMPVGGPVEVPRPVCVKFLPR